MTSAVFAIPGDIDLPTGGYIYDRRVLALLPQLGVTVRHLELPGSFPDPDARPTWPRRRAFLPACRPRRVLMVDGLAYGAMPAELIARVRAPIVALVHHPLCLEAGLSPSAADAAARPGDGGAGAGRARRRHEPDHGAHAGRGLRRAGGQDHRRRARHRSGAARDGHRPAPLQLLASARSCRARPTTFSCARSAPLRIATGASPSPARPTAARRRSPRCAPPCARPACGHRVTLARRRRPAEARPSSTPQPMSSSCRRSTRATAWCWPRPWRAACPSSARPAARRRRRRPTRPPSRCRRATSARSPPPSAACWTSPTCAAAWPMRPGPPARSCRAGRIPRAPSPASSRSWRR